MNLKERKVIQRRLPLWESAIMNADKNDFKRIKDKIDNARKLLNMPPFDYSNILNGNVKNRKVIKDKEIKTIPGLRNKVKFDKYEYSVAEVAEMKNKLKMSDQEIAFKMKMGTKGFNIYKAENFKETYRLRDDSPITVRRYCNIKNETKMTDSDIMRMFDIKYRDTLTLLKKKVVLRWVVNENVAPGSKEHKRAKEFCELFNKHKLDGRKIAALKGVTDVTVSKFKSLYIKEEWQPLELKSITPEIYCHLKNDLLMSDKDIVKKYNISCIKNIYRLKEKYLENHFELLEEI